MDCHGVSLGHIPVNIPVNTVCLILSDNHITNVDSELSFLKYLKVLDLSYNKLQKITSHGFLGLENLTEMRLNNNDLLFDNQTIPQGSFDNLRHLRSLRIHNNKRQIRGDYRDDIFWNLSELLELHMDGLPAGRPFNKAFLQLHKLLSLDLYGDFDYITNITFQNM